MHEIFFKFRVAGDKFMPKKMRKPEYYRKIDMYLNHELSDDELKEFNVELLLNLTVAEEVELHREVQQAVQEEDIMALRYKLEVILKGKKYAKESTVKTVMSAEDMNYNFGLSGEFSSFREFFKPVEATDLNRLSHSLPRIHLFQHGLAGKENIHQFYKEQFGDSENEEELLSPADEAIFAEVRDALSEKDIFELRANLRQIAERLPEHERSTEEIDKYLNEEMKPDQQVGFEEEAIYNQQLREDIVLHREIESAVLETDIMELRTSLAKIQGIEHSTERVEDIDRYITGELSNEELKVFEDKLSSNPVLASDVRMYREIDSALEESDIMKIRSKLQTISKEVVKDRQRAIRMPLSKLAIASIAASLALILSIGGWILRQTSSDGEIYSEFYQPYQSTGIIRSGNTTMDNTLTEALQKFNAQEYESALALFRQVVAYDSKNPVVHFYSGASYQETGRFNKAIEEYEIVVKDRDNLFVEQAEWYIGLCYLQTQERRKAYRQLQRISKSNSYYSKKAEAIIRRLKLIKYKE